MYRRMMCGVMLLALVSGCSKDKEKDAAAEKPKTERERDSVLAHSKIPGATGVGKAMTVADSAGSRVQLQDSIANSQ